MLLYSTLKICQTANRLLQFPVLKPIGPPCDKIERFDFDLIFVPSVSPRSQKRCETSHDLLVQNLPGTLVHRRPVQEHLRPQQRVPRPRGLRPRPQDGLKLLDRPPRLAHDEVVGLVQLLAYFPVVVVGERLLRVESPLPNVFLFVCQLLLLVGVVIFKLVAFFCNKIKCSCFNQQG